MTPKTVLELGIGSGWSVARIMINPARSTPPVGTWRQQLQMRQTQTILPSPGPTPTTTAVSIQRTNNNGLFVDGSDGGGVALLLLEIILPWEATCWYHPRIDRNRHICHNWHDHRNHRNHHNHHNYHNRSNHHNYRNHHTYYRHRNYCNRHYHRNHLTMALAPMTLPPAAMGLSTIDHQWRKGGAAHASGRGGTCVRVG